MKVSRFEAKAALLQSGDLGKVEAAVSEADDMTRLAWQEASFDRLSPFISTMQTELKWSDEEVDDLFEAALELRHQ